MTSYSRLYDDGQHPDPDNLDSIIPLHVLSILTPLGDFSALGAHRARKTTTTTSATIASAGSITVTAAVCLQDFLWISLNASALLGALKRAATTTAFAAAAAAASISTTANTPSAATALSTGLFS